MPSLLLFFCVFTSHAIGTTQAASTASTTTSVATINDVSQLNPIEVDKVETPTNTEEVQRLVKEWKGPISIGGGRFSMGGQIGSERTLHLDMRKMDRVLALDKKGRSITVEAGITWRRIQERVDPENLSVKIMQTFANFTVGGSLSVNAHGRYVGVGPIVNSVKQIKLVLADGSLVTASPSDKPEIFFGAIGGYGGLGVIVEATLDLAENVKMERQASRLSLADYKKNFLRNIRGNKHALFHNGDISPPEFDKVTSITWLETEKPLTVPDRLMPVRAMSWKDRVLLFGLSEVPLGKELRARWVEPWRTKGEPVVWRNYEASYDVSSLEPSSRLRTTYVLQEYFVPVDRLEDFAKKMGMVFQKHKANVLNVSIRHSPKDPGVALAWAREEVFAFVIYYKQRTSPEAKAKVGEWTRELIEAALSLGGTYYLPYQLHATEEQFRRAYPGAEKFFLLKTKLDPHYRFRNKLWGKYYKP